MGFAACLGAIAQCPMGVAPTPLAFLPGTLLETAGPIGQIPDCIPFLNIVPFGVCKSLANPITAALTAAAFGVLTPGPCIPTPAGTWLPVKPNVLGAKGPVITSDSMIICAYGGCIKINVAPPIVIC